MKSIFDYDRSPTIRLATINKYLDKIGLVITVETPIDDTYARVWLHLTTRKAWEKKYPSCVVVSV